MLFRSSPTGDLLQPDPEFYEQFAFIDNPDRRANHAMVATMDAVVGNVTAALRSSGLWNNTLLLWSSDNGGAMHLYGGANSYPLKGGYMNNHEGGIRVAALLSGGFLPAHARGQTLEGFIHEADWFSTFCHLAGVPPHDARAAAAGLPPIDSHNVWPLITGDNATSPRYEWPITPMGEDLARCDTGGDAAYMAEGRYKLIYGKIMQSGWCGQVHPNVTAPWDSFDRNSTEHWYVLTSDYFSVFYLLPTTVTPYSFPLSFYYLRCAAAPSRTTARTAATTRSAASTTSSPTPRSTTTSRWRCPARRRRSLLRCRQRRSIGSTPTAARTPRAPRAPWPRKRASTSPGGPKHWRWVMGATCSKYFTQYSCTVCKKQKLC